MCSMLGGIASGRVGFNIIFVTNRALLPPGEIYLDRMEMLASAKPDGIILREKELDEGAYRTLARDALRICGRYGVPCILHGFPETAAALRSPRLHLPLSALRELSETDRRRFTLLGASCHSVEDAEEAQRLGCRCITAGHIYPTDCKKGLPGRGIGFLREVCSAVGIPVYAIGGICAENIYETALAGAAGACVMSGAMRCADASKYLRLLRQCAKGAYNRGQDD